MASFSELPVLEVNSDNFRQIWPAITAAIKNATFLALDCELSGLGDRKQLFAKDMSIRYDGMKKTAQSRSIISLGLSFFKMQPTVQPRLPNDSSKVVNKSLPFLVQTFNILVLCNENYMVEPASLKFLLEHGFDFNKQYSKGLPYYRGSDQASDKEGQSLRRLFSEIVQSRVPIVLHNAPMDLIFLYHSFYSNLPLTMESFLADMSEVFAGGVYDTKYIAEYKARFSASYLEYVFRKCQRQNKVHETSGLCHTRLLFPPYPRQVPHIAWMPCGLKRSQEGMKSKPCRDFGSHGHCNKRDSCLFSHDIDVILDSEEQITARKRNKRRKKQLTKESTVDNQNGDKSNTDNEEEEVSTDEESEEDKEDSVTAETQQNKPKSDTPVFKMGGHRAGYDAFMTGMAFAFFLAKYGSYEDIEENMSLVEFGMEEYINKVALSGKDIPLQISKSTFSKTSKEHKVKIQRLMDAVTVRGTDV